MRKRFAAQFFALQTVLKGVFMTDSRRKIAALLFIIVTAAVLFLFSGNGDTAYAAENLTNGTYTVSVSNDMPMGKDNISDTAVLEKQNGMYYLSLTFNVAKLADIRLEIEDKTVGSQVVEESEDTATYCYTLSKKKYFIAAPVCGGRSADGAERLKQRDQGYGQFIFCGKNERYRRKPRGAPRGVCSHASDECRQRISAGNGNDFYRSVGRSRTRR